MKMLLGLMFAFLLAGCATAPANSPADSLDRIAEDYVKLQLVIGEKEEGYVDAYYGPTAWRERARAEAPAATLPQLRERVAALAARIGAVEAVSSYPAGSIEARRSAFLRANLTAADTRLRMLQGERLSFADEAQGLFGVNPTIRPLSDYDPILARIEQLVPGTGPLADRVEAFANRFTVPRERVDGVIRASIAECRRRTTLHIPLPAEESFTLELVTGRSWSGYNWYQGNYRSLIQVNTDLPLRIARAVDLGCHEGYPGHHVHNMLLERDLARGRGWAEYQVYPLYSPQSLIAEGSANYGYELAFPGGERLAFETATLYPLAGLPTEGAAEYLALGEAMAALAGARFTIAREFLEGRIDRAEALRLLQRYQLSSAPRAEQNLAFIEQYRTYVINYGLGRDMVASFIEAQGADQSTRWQVMRRILSEPTLPSDLRVP
jgi:hypothetical protein